MPRGDGTGPWGLGPMTGRGAGYCAGFNVPGFINPLPRRFGFGRGLGRGRGWRNWYYATGMPGWMRIRIGLPAFGRGFGWSYPYLVQSTSITPAQFQPQLTKEQEIRFLEQEIKALEEEKKMIDRDLDKIGKRLKELKG